MTIKLSTGLRTALAGTTGFGATFDKGVIHIYSGPQPSSADAPVSGTLLGIVTSSAAPFTFGDPANGLEFDPAVAGTVSKSSTQEWKFKGIANGTAGWFRLMGNALDSLGSSTVLPRLDGSIGTSGADLNLSNIAVAIGAPATIDIFNFTIPAQ